MEEINKLNPTQSKNNESKPWWLFLNILALDAPVVAVVWQYFFSKTFEIEITFTENAVLFFTVWFIYLLDHFLDSRKEIYITQRHLFVEKNPKLTLVLISLTFLISILLSFSLSKLFIISGIILGILISIYLLLVHSNITAPMIKKTCKELLVGIGFGTGVALPVIVSELSIKMWLPSVILFCLICWINCKLIENWESGYYHFDNLDIILSLATVFCMLMAEKQIIFASLISITAFIMIDKFAGSKNIQLSRVLVDASLLSPLVFVNHT
ncbi:MAG: hypothetical protein EBT92_06810 [Planctomycetes bacterium]|nr:hypothetical protein [Planctomycetota bacterium]